MTQQSYAIEPIGYIRTSNGETVLQIEEKFRPGLTGLDGFSHIQVLFWCHLVDQEKYRNQPVFDKPYTKGPDKLGVFATRSPMRPNPMALTPVQLLHIEPDTGVIRIPFIDAEDKTPIIDLKPYTPSIDRVKETDSPDWCAHWPRWYEDSATFDWASEFNF